MMDEVTENVRRAADMSGLVSASRLPIIACRSGRSASTWTTMPAIATELMGLPWPGAKGLVSRRLGG